MRYDLKAPCKNCPFRSDDTRIVFACRERAEEIEEQAYRHGFPCHLSAVLDEDKEDAGYEPGPNTQHCVGYIAVQLKENGDGSPWPGIDNNEALLERINRRIDAWKLPVFESSEDFITANEPRNHPKRYRTAKRKCKTKERT